MGIWWTFSCRKSTFNNSDTKLRKINCFMSPGRLIVSESDPYIRTIVYAWVQFILIYLPQQFIIDKKIMFFCDQCKHESSSEATLKYHQDTLHQDTKYDCNICGVQVSSMESLIQHKKAVHEGVNYPCRQWGNQATTKGSLTEHKRAVHEGVKYPCGQCSYQATTKGSLAPCASYSNYGQKRDTT